MWWRAEGQLALQSKFCHSGKCRHNSGTDVHRHKCTASFHAHVALLRTTDLIPNFTVVLQPIKYLCCLPEYVLFTLQSIKYLHRNLFLKILCFKYVYTTAYWESGDLGPGSGFWQGCVTLGKSIHFSDYLMYNMRGKDCGVSEIFSKWNTGSSPPGM